MNRIVLIGNGFDLAHNLKTGYNDFICWYWDRWYDEIKRSNKTCETNILCSIAMRDKRTPLYSFIYSHSRSVQKEGYDYITYIRDKRPYGVHFILTPFMENISNSVETKGWVDIENEYYRLLCSYVKDKEDEKVVILNKQLDYLTTLLVEYLQEIEKSAQNTFCEEIKKIIYSPFKGSEIAISGGVDWKKLIGARYESIDLCLDLFNEYYQTLKSYEHIYDFKSQLKSFDKFKNVYKDQIEYFDINSIEPDSVPDCLRLPDRIMLLNFNYTDTANQYVEKDTGIFEINHIHGELANRESVIFGYGDELDEQYKAILNLNNNDYLNNTKSIKYLEAANYREMLSFIESDLFQVYILGHSCGNSDRTLLNTIFEHKNCVSIKPYYHKKDDDSDDYIKIIQNISRNFTNMKLMRDRVVNKNYCEPLPQIAKI